MKIDNEENGHLDVISIDRFLVELKILPYILVVPFVFKFKKQLMRCGTEPLFKVLLLQNIEMLFLLRDQHADDVKEDFEERTESEMRTSHETRGSHNNLILLMDITVNTQLSELNWNMAITFVLKINFIWLVCSIITDKKIYC